MNAYGTGWAAAATVAGPLLAAFLQGAAGKGKVGQRVRSLVFALGLLAGAAAAGWVAWAVLWGGVPHWTYVFGAGAGESFLPSGAGGAPIRIQFHVDAVGAMMLLVTALTSLAAGAVALRSEQGTSGRAGFQSLYLLLVAGVYGMCATGDAFNFFVFLEITSLAGSALTAYRLDKGLAAEAGLKYAAISSLGGLSFLMGVGLLLGQHNLLNLAALADHFRLHGLTRLDETAFLLMAVPLAMKCGAAPMHHWTPDTYSRAPVPVSAFLLVSSQASLYGLYRVSFTLFGGGGMWRVAGLGLTAMAVASMFIGVTMAIIQHDVKRLIAHHAVSQTGYMLLGAGVCLAALGRPGEMADYGRDALAGGLFHMVNYAIYNGLLFLGAGAVIWRTGRRNLDEMGGLARRMPWTTACFGVGALAIAGIPPMSGFASKWVLYESVFRMSPLLSVVAMAVSLLTLASFVKVFQAMFLGAERKAFAAVREVPWSWRIAMAALAALTVLIGLFPDATMDHVVRPAADALLDAGGYVGTMARGG